MVSLNNRDSLEFLQHTAMPPVVLWENKAEHLQFFLLNIAHVAILSVWEI